MPMDLFAALAPLPVFAGAAPEHLMSLAADSDLRHVRPHGIVTGGEPASDDCYLVLTGRVKVSAEVANGHRMFLHECRGPEFFFTERFLRSGGPRIVGEALEGSQVVAIPQPTLQRFLRLYPALGGRLLLQEMATRTVLLDRLSDIVSLHVPERLARCLLTLGRRYGTKREDGSIQLDLGLTHLELATTIGTSRETATTLLNEFKARQLIAIGRKTLTILDAKGLAQLGGVTEWEIHAGIHANGAKAAKRVTNGAGNTHNGTVAAEPAQSNAVGRTERPADVISHL